MRVVLIAILLLPLLAAGCGGTEVRVEEVPGSPPPLALPASEDGGLADDAEDTSDRSEDDEPDADAAADADTGAAVTPEVPADSGGAAVPPTDTGGAAPAPTATPAPQDPAATGGAEADAGSDEFCADNPGAC